MFGSERATVFEIDSHGAEEQGDFPRVGNIDDVAEVGPKISVGGLELGIVGRDLTVEEHLHSQPGRRLPAVFDDGSCDGLQDLADAGTTGRQVRGDQRTAGEQGREHGPGTEGASDFVVAHIDDEEIGFQIGAGAGDAESDMGVDRDGGGVDDFEVDGGVLVGEHGFEDARKAEQRFGIALCGGTAKDEDAAGVVGFGCGQSEGLDFAGHLRLEELPGEIGITESDGAAFDDGRIREGHRPADFAEDEDGFDGSKDDQRSHHDEQETEEPDSAAGDWRAGMKRGFGFGWNRRGLGGGARGTGGRRFSMSRLSGFHGIGSSSRFMNGSQAKSF